MSWILRLWCVEEVTGIWTQHGPQCQWNGKGRLTPPISLLKFQILVNHGGPDFPRALPSRDKELSGPQHGTD